MSRIGDILRGEQPQVSTPKAAPAPSIAAGQAGAAWTSHAERPSIISPTGVQAPGIGSAERPHVIAPNAANPGFGAHIERPHVVSPTGVQAPGLASGPAAANWSPMIGDPRVTSPKNGERPLDVGAWPGGTGSAERPHVIAPNAANPGFGAHIERPHVVSPTGAASPAAPLRTGGGSHTMVNATKDIDVMRHTVGETPARAQHDVARHTPGESPSAGQKVPEGLSGMSAAALERACDAARACAGQASRPQSAGLPEGPPHAPNHAAGAAQGMQRG